MKHTYSVLTGKGTDERDTRCDVWYVYEDGFKVCMCVSQEDAERTAAALKWFNDFNNSKKEWEFPQRG